MNYLGLQSTGPEPQNIEWSGSSKMCCCLLQTGLLDVLGMPIIVIDLKQVVNDL